MQPGHVAAVLGERHAGRRHRQLPQHRARSLPIDQPGAALPGPDHSRENHQARVTGELARRLTLLQAVLRIRHGDQAKPGTASSNADEPDETDANHPEHVSADHPTHRTGSDGFDHDRARFLIRGFGVRVPGGAPVTLHFITSLRRPVNRVAIGFMAHDDDQAAHWAPVARPQRSRARPWCADRGDPGIGLIPGKQKSLPVLPAGPQAEDVGGWRRYAACHEP
jgi:hypothetical protein